MFERGGHVPGNVRRFLLGDIDVQILAAARELLDRADAYGLLAGKYIVLVQNSQQSNTGDAATINEPFTRA